MGTEPYTAAPPMQPQQLLGLLPAITALRLRYLQSGYTPLPCLGKAPALRNWQATPIDATQIKAWGLTHRNALNTGVRSASTPAVDIDITDAPLALLVERMLLKYLPQDRAILRRVGRAPKTLIPFRAATPFKKCSLTFATPDGIVHRVEVLGDGQQFIAEGWHPDTGAPYMWQGDKLADVPLSELPALDESTAHKFLAELFGFVAGQGWRIAGSSKPAETPRRNSKGTSRASCYAQAALDRECETVAGAIQGSRIDALNRASFSLFQLVAGGELEEAEVIARLGAAAAACGLLKDDGETAVARTIESGARAGRSEPRHAPKPNTKDHHDEDHHPECNDVPDGTANGGALPPPPRGKRVELITASAFEQQSIDWLWKPRLARGKIALIAGDPGVGKSSLVADLVARVSAGRPWPDGGTAPVGNCIILSAEDAAADTICPRLEVAGADLNRVFLMRMTGGPGTKLTFSLGQDLPLLAAAIERLGDVALLTIDPITAYLGDKVDTHQTAAVRAVLEPLDSFAARYRCATVGVTHPPKATQTKAMHAFTGSLAFVAAARTAFVAVEEPETDRRLLLAVKSNIGPQASGIAYRLTTAQTSKQIEAVRVEWDGEPVDINANEAIAAAAEDRRSTGRSEAEEFLQGYLENGPMPVDQIATAAAANGINERTLRRAKTRLRIVSAKSGYQGAWVWRLPS